MADFQVVERPAEAAAGRIADAVRAGGHIALAGGSTPRAAYGLVADMDLDWSDATLWFGDERCVAPDHEHSNYRMAKEALLDRLEGGRPVVHRIRGELGPDEGAASYERVLLEGFAPSWPRLDLVLLGLGPDAHCASLFPHAPTLLERERAVAGVQVAGLEPFVPRVTLTLPAINAARHVVFLVAGEDKAQAVARAFGGESDPGAPASLVRPEDGRLTLLLDPGAASAA